MFPSRLRLPDSALVALFESQVRMTLVPSMASVGLRLISPVEVRPISSGLFWFIEAWSSPQFLAPLEVDSFCPMIRRGGPVMAGIAPQELFVAPPPLQAPAAPRFTFVCHHALAS